MFALTNYWVFILPIIAGLMCTLGYTIYIDNPRSWTNRFFCLLTVSIGIWMFLWVVHELYVSRYVGMEIEPYTFIIFLYETQFYFIAFIGPLFLLTVLEVSGLLNSDNRFKITALIMVFPLINISLLTYSIAAGHEWMHHYGTISDGSFPITQGPLFQYFHVPYNYIMIVISYIILIWKAVKPRYYLERSQSLTLLVGSLLGLIGNLITITGTNPLTGMYYVDVTFLGFGGTVVVYGYAIWKHRLINIAPNVEDIKDGESELSLEEGIVYLTDDPGKAFDVFADLVHHGTPGLAFSTKDKEEIRAEYNLEKTSLVKLSETLGRDTLNPDLEEHAEMIPFLISDFMGETDESVVIIHGLDEWKERPKIVQLIQDLYEGLSEDDIIIFAVSEEVGEEVMEHLDDVVIKTL